MDGLRVAKVENVVLEGTERKPPYARIRVQGTLHLTPHHLFFAPDPTLSSTASSIEKPQSTAAESNDEIWIPYPTINVLQRLPQSAAGKYPLLVGTKTFDTYTLLFEKWGQGGAEDVWYSVRDCAVSQSVEQLYAFFYTLPKSPVATTSAVAHAPAPSSPPPPAVAVDTTATTVSNPLSPLASSPESPLPAPVASVAPETAPPASGWSAYNPRTEFARQGVGVRTNAWRFTDVNKDYTFSPTYPAKLVVPRAISDQALLYGGKFRSKSRIPALTYLHWANEATITRCSQPMVGIKGARSPQDEKLVECIFTSHRKSASAASAGSAQISPSVSFTNLTALPDSNDSKDGKVYGATATNLIVDARPSKNAYANMAKGAGSEVMEYYRLAQRAFLDIDNIHVMRNSLKTVVETLAEANAGGLPVNRERLRKSGWLKHLGAILAGSRMIVHNIHVNASHVLIHCSDGWDRTSQLSAIAQLCLDPYYRTMEGFRVLVEKDWLSFGHMFLQRSGHLSSTKLFTETPDNIDAIDDESDDDFGLAVKGAQAFFASMSKQFQSSSHLKEISPVFHQFIDCVYQLQRQFPDRFEFNEDYLIDLHTQLYACQFGTFLFDSERARRLPPSPKDKPYIDRTVSVWEWFDLPAQRERHLNAEYRPELNDRDARGPNSDMGVLVPDPNDVRFWHRLFKRSEDDMNMSDKFLPVAPEPVLVAPPPATEAPMSTMPGALPGASGGTPSAPAAALPYQPRVHSSKPAPPRPEITRAPSSSTSTPSRAKWSWNSVGSGALSAFNQIKSNATDALQHLRATEDEWGSTSPYGSEMTFEPGTGIGEGGRAGTTPGKVRGPLEANPWDDPPPRKTSLGALQGSDGLSGGLEQSGVGHGGLGLSSERPPLQSLRETQAEKTSPSSNGAPPRRSGTAELAANPWSDTGSLGQSLSDLTLDPAKSKSEAARKEAERAEKAEIEAALGGSRAWDPLGAT